MSATALPSSPTTLPMHYRRIALGHVRTLKAADPRGEYNEHTGERYCIHGRNLGTWDGPDYMCGYCEDGTSVYGYALSLAWEQYRYDRYARVRRMWDALSGDPETGIPPARMVFSADEFEHIVGGLTDAMMAVLDGRF